MAKKIKITVALNGTNENPYHKSGLTQNPLPQIAEYRYTGSCLVLQSLGGDPIPHNSPDEAKDYIRKTLKGFTTEFVEYVCSQFKPGEYVRFEVEFPES